MKKIYIPGDRERFGNYHRWAGRQGLVCTGTAEKAEVLLLPGGGDVEPWRYGAENTASSIEPGRDEAELALIDAFVRSGKPILGICRGLQIINVYFGGSLVQDIPGHSQVQGRDRRHRVRTAPSFLQALYGQEMEVNSAHHQALGRLGTGLRAIQWAEGGVVEAVVHERFPVLGLQWHPERLGPAGDRLWSVLEPYLEKSKNF